MASKLKIRVNGLVHNVTANLDTPLLYVLRNELNLNSVRFGCGLSRCGACTVHVDGSPMRSCALRIGTLGDREITTIEAIAEQKGHPVVLAWIEEQVPQCGYCQAGQIMTATALLASNPTPSDADIDREMTNICRCGTYAEIRAAIRKASDLMAKG